MAAAEKHTLCVLYGVEGKYVDARKAFTICEETITIEKGDHTRASMVGTDPAPSKLKHVLVKDELGRVRKFEASEEGVITRNADGLFDLRIVGMVPQSIRDGSATCCHVTEWSGRSGNNIIQLLHAIYCAERHGHTRVVFPRHSLLTATELSIRPLAGAPRAGADERKRFYWTRDFSDLPRPTSGVLRDIGRRYVVPICAFAIDEVLTDDGVAHVHVRSGDTFCKRPPDFYVPPPLDYYNVVLAGYSRAVVVYEDLANPCAGYLAERFTSQSSSLSADLTTLMAARTLVAGYGTFCLIVYFLSPNLRRLVLPDYCAADFAGSSSLQPPHPFGDTGDVEVTYVRLPGYIRQGEWRNTDEQREFMLTYSGAAVGDIDTPAAACGPDAAERNPES